MSSGSTGLTTDYMEKIKLANEGRYSELAARRKGAKDGKRKKNPMMKSNNSNFFDYSSPERNLRVLNTEGTDQGDAQYPKAKAGYNPNDESGVQDAQLPAKNSCSNPLQPYVQMSNGKGTNTRLHLAGGKTAAKKSKTFNYKDQPLNGHSNTAVKNPGSKLKSDMLISIRNKNFAYGEGMENIMSSVHGHGNSCHYAFGGEQALST